MAINKSTTFATNTGSLGWKSGTYTGAVGGKWKSWDVREVFFLVRTAVAQ